MRCIPTADYSIVPLSTVGMIRPVDVAHARLTRLGRAPLLTFVRRSTGTCTTTLLLRQTTVCFQVLLTILSNAILVPSIFALVQPVPRFTTIPSLDFGHGTNRVDTLVARQVPIITHVQAAIILGSLSKQNAHLSHYLRLR